MTDPELVRPAVIEDFEALYSLYKELVGTIDVPEGSLGRARLAEILAFPGTSIIVATAGTGRFRWQRCTCCRT